MIDANAIALYVKVVENQSFSTTAEREGVPLSTVSRKVAELEKALGVRLLERSTRRMRTTSIGQEYYERCRLGVEEFEAANLLVRDRQADVVGTLRLSVPPAISDAVVTPLVLGFRQRYPRVTFRVLVTDRYVNLIEDGVDLALRVGEAPDTSLVVRRLLQYRHVLVASPEYLARAAAPRQPRDLWEHPLIAFARWHGDTVWRLTDGSRTEEVRVGAGFSINDYEGVLRAVREGAGIGELPSLVYGTELDAGRLVEVMPDWRFEPVTLSAVYSDRRNLSRVTRLFKDFCAERIEEVVPHAKR